MPLDVGCPWYYFGGAIIIYPTELDKTNYTLPCIPNSTMYIYSRFFENSDISSLTVKTSNWSGGKTSSVDVPNTIYNNGTPVLLGDISSIQIANPSTNKFRAMMGINGSGQTITVPKYTWTCILKIRVEE